MISASSLGNSADCQRRSAARRIPHVIEEFGYTLRVTDPSAGARLGTPVHVAAAELLRGRAVENIISARKVADAIEQAWEFFKRSIKDGIFWDPTTKNSHEAHLQLVAMIHSIVPVCQGLNPEQIEFYFEAKVRSIGVKLSGHIDLREVTRTIWDFKTGVKEPSPWEQLGQYSILSNANGLQCDEVGMIFAPRLRPGKDQPPPTIRRKPAAEAERCAWTAIGQMHSFDTKFMESGDPWVYPANPRSQLCTPDYCGAHGTPFCTVGKPIGGS